MHMGAHSFPLPGTFRNSRWGHHGGQPSALSSPVIIPSCAHFYLKPSPWVVKAEALRSVAQRQHDR